MLGPFETTHHTPTATTLWTPSRWLLLSLCLLLWSTWQLACGDPTSPKENSTVEATNDASAADAPVGDSQPDASSPEPSSETGGQDQADGVADKTGTGQHDDPFAPLPDTSEGLTNTSSDLKALLEQGTLKDACKAYEADPTDRKKMLLCGKYMFFYETFGTVGVPKVLPSLLMKHFPDDVGKGFAKFGMIADPYASDDMPLGMADSVKLGGKVETVAYTCASCHFSQLPDGRYSAGGPNYKYEYGKQILAISVFPMIATGLRDKSSLAPEVQAILAPLITKAEQDPKIKEAFLSALLPLATNPDAKIPEFPKQAQIYYASWPSGTMDFLIEPLPVNDGVHTVSKILALWNIPTPSQRDKVGMLHGMLSWTGGTVSLMRFLEGFVEFGKGDVKAWPADKLKPLAEYIYSLRAPKNPTAPAADLVAKGKVLFAEKGCLSCHNGTGGSGKKLYSYDEIGTDPGMKKWLDPELDGAPCCDIKLRDGEPLTHKLKSPRLVGTWAMTRFLHNGALPSLEALFCLDGPRAKGTAHGLGTDGHTMTCDGLTKDQKLALIAYLNAQ